MTKKAIIFIFSFFLSTSVFSSEIVASVKPLHSLVSAVTQGAHTVSFKDGPLSKTPSFSNKCETKNHPPLIADQLNRKINKGR